MQDEHVQDDFVAVEDVEEVVEPTHLADDAGMEDMEEQEEQEEGMHDDDMMELKDDSVQGFFDHKEPVYAVAIHPIDLNIVCSGGGDDKAYLWRSDTGERIAELEKHEDSVTAVEFNVDGTFVAVGGMDGRVKVYTTRDGVKILDLEAAEITSLEFHPRGNVLLASTADASIYMWLIPSGTLLHVLAGPHAGSVSMVTFTPDGKKVVSCCEDGSVALWDPKTGVPVWSVGGHGARDARWHEGGIMCVAVNPDGGIIATGGEDGSCKLIHASNGQIVGSLDGHRESIESISFCTVLPLIATASVDGTVQVYDVNTHQRRITLSHDDAVVKAEWIQGEPYLLTCSVDRTIRKWDGRTGEGLRLWQGHQEPILCMAVSRDGNMVITGSDDGCALVFRQ